MFSIRRMGRMIVPVSVLALFALWTVSPWGVSVEQRLGLELLFQWRGERAPPPGVVVLAITRESAQALGLSEKPHQWSRSIHAQAVERLQALGAQRVVFDIFFEQPRDEAGDRAFAEALRRAGNVLLFARAERQQIALGQAELADQQSIVQPLTMLAQAAQETAPLILPKIPARVDRFFLRHPTFPSQLTLHARAWQLQNPATRILPDDSLLYNFYGPPRSIPTFEYAQLIQQPDTVAEQIRNAVVFIGYSASYQHDQRDGFYTAFTADSGLDISGVELAATAFANLVDDSWLREIPPWLQLILVWCYGVLVFVLARTLAPVMSAVLQLLAVGIASALICVLFVAYQLWLPWFNGVLLLTPLAGGVGMWLRSRELHQQKARLQLAFGKYLPAEEIRRLVMQAELPATQEHHHSVCLVTDAQGYSRLSEQLSPVELSQLMQDYYSAVIGAIRAGKGLISDVAGDGIIALWPHLEPEQAWPTLAPVVSSILQAVQQFNERHPQHALPTRIGIHAGEIVLGHFGALDHYEFRAMGDIVNTTARLEGVNKQIGTQVLLSEDSVTHPDEKVRNLGRFRFVGKQNPLRLYSPVSNEPAELLHKFSLARDEFERGNWSQAAQMFSAISAQFPMDGPSRFFAEFLAEPEQRSGLLEYLDAGVIPLIQK